MKNTEHTRLLRELASYVHRGQSATRFWAKKELEEWQLLDSSYHPESVRQDILWISQADELIARAIQVAEEIEGREMPSDEELAEAFADGCFPEAGSSLMLDELIDFNLLERFTTLTAEQVIIGGLRAVLARFGGGEGAK